MSDLLGPPPDPALRPYDQERADRFIELRAAADLATDARTDELRHDLAEEFASVRLAERRAIVAWLRDRSHHRPGQNRYDDADRIARGEHGS